MRERFARFGDVAQLGERGVRNAEAEGSNPFISTMFNLADRMNLSASLLFSGCRRLWRLAFMTPGIRDA